MTENGGEAIVRKLIQRQEPSFGIQTNFSLLIVAARGCNRGNPVDQRCFKLFSSSRASVLPFDDFSLSRPSVALFNLSLDLLLPPPPPKNPHRFFFFSFWPTLTPESLVVAVWLVNVELCEVSKWDRFDDEVTDSLGLAAVISIFVL